MKKILFALFLLSTLNYADQSLIASNLVNPDTMFTVTEDTSIVDTVNISEIVRSQIEMAQMSSIITSVSYGTPKREEPKPPVKIQKIEEKSFLENMILMLQEFNSKYSSVLIFTVSSVFILSVVFGRRFIKTGLKGSKGRLRKAVNLIRSEKPMHSENKKLKELRKKLSESTSIFDISEATISEKAKGLNVGKGELMLAAKVKAFQLSKVLSR